jgi:MHS family alpha-ketoglutarate permease-like MFS transporter
MHRMTNKANGGGDRAAASYQPQERRKRIFAIVTASSGNLVEWFDFYIYSFCSIYFAPAFFPKSDPTAQLLNSAGIFAFGFLMRPIGGWLFGRVADRSGRKRDRQRAPQGATCCACIAQRSAPRPITCSFRI